MMMTEKTTKTQKTASTALKKTLQNGYGEEQKPPRYKKYVYCRPP